MKIKISIICLLVAAYSFGQEKTSLSGTLTDAATGETITSGKVRILEKTGTAVLSNEYGFYSLSVSPPGIYKAIISASGFATDTISVDLTADKVLDYKLASKSKEIEDVNIFAKKKNDNITDAQVGVEKLDIKELNKIPVLLGERDILKTIQLLPGIKSSGEGNSGLNVRGGAADQNLILLDEAPVYNASHLLGFFSTFNSDAVKDVTVFKGTQPAQYGGRLASALDVKMKDGNNQKFGFSGGIGLIASRFNLEGPIKKGKGSFLISGRRTYADLFLKLAPDTNLRKNRLFFYDLNLKASYNLGKKDRIFVSGYFGRDILGVGKVFTISWGNATGTVRWNHIYNSKLFSNTSFILSNFKYNIGLKAGDTQFDIYSQVQDYNLKHEFQYFYNEKHSFRFGANVITHEIIPGEIRSKGAGINSRTAQRQQSLESAIFFQDEWKVSTRFNMNIGLRASSFIVSGKGKYYTLDANNDVDTFKIYASGKIIKNYLNLEPRASFAYIINESQSIKGGYARNTQNLHLISNATASSPTDRWLSNTNIVKPEISDQVSLGWYKNIKKDAYQFSADVYYKQMQNQIDYKDGSNTNTSNDVPIETQLLFGKGRAYGIELLIRKKEGRFTGWIGYTLSKSEKKITGINKDQWYNARQDRTHDISVVLMYEITKRVNVSGLFVYTTGNAITFPTGKYEVNGVINYSFSERNGYRVPAYHRADVGLNWELKEKKWFTHELTFSIYNLYARQNTYSIAFETDKNDPQKTNAVQTALFKIIPSISWNFKFK
jgi:TonB-dependent Receptor Plug Domain/Carboxypeptidase regulatory-like domain